MAGYELTHPWGRTGALEAGTDGGQTHLGVVAWVFASAVFVPGHLLGWAVEWGWLLFAISIAFSACLFSRQPLRVAGDLDVFSWLGAHAVLQCLLLAGASYAVLVQSVPMGPRDLSEFLRLPSYALFGLFIGTLSSRKDLPFVDAVLKAMVLFGILCAVVLIAKIPVLHSLLDILYAGAKNQVGFGVYRFSIPFANPNFLAFVLLPVLAYFLFYRRSMVFSILALVGLGLTGSRSGWISAVPLVLGAYFYALGSSAVNRPGLKTVVLAAAPVVLGIAVFANLDLLRSVQRLAELLDAVEGRGISGVQTASIRLSGGSHLLTDYVSLSPLLGWGAGRDLGIDVADNQYISWMLMYGLVGSAIFFLLVASMILRLITASRGARHLVGGVSLACAVGAMLFTGDFLENYRLYFLLVFVLHMSYLSIQPDRDVGEQAVCR